MQPNVERCFMQDYGQADDGPRRQNSKTGDFGITPDAGASKYRTCRISEPFIAFPEMRHRHKASELCVAQSADPERTGQVPDKRHQMLAARRWGHTPLTRHHMPAFFPIADNDRGIAPGQNFACLPDIPCRICAQLFGNLHRGCIKAISGGRWANLCSSRI